MTSSQTTFPSKQKASFFSIFLLHYFIINPIIPRPSGKKEREKVRHGSLISVIMGEWVRSEKEEIEIKRAGEGEYVVKRTNKVIKAADPPDPTNWVLGSRNDHDSSSPLSLSLSSSHLSHRLYHAVYIEFSSSLSLSLSRELFLYTLMIPNPMTTARSSWPNHTISYIIYLNKPIYISKTEFKNP